MSINSPTDVDKNAGLGSRGLNYGHSLISSDSPNQTVMCGVYMYVNRMLPFFYSYNTGVIIVGCYWLLHVMLYNSLTADRVQ